MSKTREILVALMSLCVANSAVAQDNTPKPASPATIAAQAKQASALPRDDGKDLEFARRGFVATLKDPVIRDIQGRALWDLTSYDFVKGKPPATVNPSLWRHISILKEHGLFKVREGVWQVRGLDVSNMTVIAGKNSWIIVDPLTRKEIAAAAMALVSEKLGKRPVSAVVYTHSHGDHFGGVKGVVSDADVQAGRTAIIAPEHLIEEVASENVIAGPAMGRRAVYQFGSTLPRSTTGALGSGIGTGLPSGEMTLIAPTDSIRRTGEKRVIDGVELEFQMVPETEAPAELNIMLPAQRTLLIGEFAVCSMHNILTPRGALVRNTLRWANYLTEAVRLYADRSDNLIASHCWPRFGQEEVRTFLTIQRDNYKFLHDQSVRMMNAGLTAVELAERIAPPDALAQAWHARGYYGTYNHNSKAVYQRYLGWYDANPANLHAYPPEERGKRLVAALGGTERTLALGKAAMAAGDYRWSSDLLSQLVFAEPTNEAAKQTLADSFEQQGYQAEGSLWRNMFLTAARELRQGVAVSDVEVSTDVAAAIPTRLLLDSVATRLVPEKIGAKPLRMNIAMSDRKEQAAISISNAAMSSEMGQTHAAPDVQITGPRQLVLGLLLTAAPLERLEAVGLKVTGDRAALVAFRAALEAPKSGFNIVMP